jgi:pyruvate-formate lyase-activating enzyme
LAAFVNSTIIFLTNTCPVGCATCNTGATPVSTVALTPPAVERIVRGLSEQQACLWLTWTGGEPFESFDALQAGIRIAGTLSCHSEILTSGHWYHHQPERLARLAEAGPFRLRISLDPEHQQRVSMTCIHALINETLARRIPVGFTLRSIPEMSPEPAQMLKLLCQTHPGLMNDFPVESRQFHVIPTILPMLETYSSNNKTAHSKNISGPCRQGFRERVIGPDGRIYPCCGLFGLGLETHVAVSTDPLAPIGRIQDIFSTRPLFQTLRNCGPLALGFHHSIIPDILPENGYSHQCQACRMILTSMAANDMMASPDCISCNPDPDVS